MLHFLSLFQKLEDISFESKILEKCYIYMMSIQKKNLKRISVPTPATYYHNKRPYLYVSVTCLVTSIFNSFVQMFSES